MDAWVAPSEASSSRAGSFFCSVKASSRCSVETYSSLKSAASLKARSSTFCIALDRPGCELAPPTLGSLLSASFARASNCSVGTPTFCSTGTIMPSLSSSSAASMCNGVSSGLPCSSARLVAAWTASCDFTVNLSQRIAILLPHLPQKREDQTSLPIVLQSAHKGHFRGQNHIHTRPRKGADPRPSAVKATVIPA